MPRLYLSLPLLLGMGYELDPPATRAPLYKGGSLLLSESGESTISLQATLGGPVR